MSIFNVQYNDFNGAIVSLMQDQLTDDELHQFIELLQSQKKSLAWITLSREQASLVPLFIKQGFVFHLCNENELTLICRLEPDAYAPFAPSHTVGTGGLILNNDAQVLLVRDKWMGGKGLKLPGGYVDLGEPLNGAVEREVMEETGVTAHFQSIVSVITKHPHQYGKSNLYIVCRLNAQTEEIFIQDTDEIEVAQWMDPADFIHDETSSTFHRHLVKTLLNKQGLEHDSFDFSDPTSTKMMFSSRL